MKLIKGSLNSTKKVVTTDSKIRFDYMSQHYEEILDFDLTPVQFINKFSPHLSETEARKLLSQSNLNSRLHHQISLSGGEQTRVIFSYISLIKPNFMIFDEPTNNLDLYTIDTLAELINNLECG